MPENLTATPEASRWEHLIRLGIVVALVVGVVGRFVTRSPLWLDEALSVNIAAMPLADIGTALRSERVLLGRLGVGPGEHRFNVLFSLGDSVMMIFLTG